MLSVDTIGIIVTAVALLACFMPLPLANSSYVNNDIDEPRGSGSQSGVTTPREYFLPSIPPYDKLDLNEFNDYRKTSYSPYAQLQLQHPIQIGSIRLEEGYYSVKVVIPKPLPAPLHVSRKSRSPDAGPSVSLLERLQGKTMAQREQEERFKRQVLPADSTLLRPSAQSTDWASDSQMSMVVKKAGQVEVIVPINRSDLLPIPLKSGSVAQLIVEAGNSLQPKIVFLQYCSGNTCYRSVPLEPGLVQ